MSLKVSLFKGQFIGKFNQEKFRVVMMKNVMKLFPTFQNVEFLIIPLGGKGFLMSIAFLYWKDWELIYELLREFIFDMQILTEKTTDTDVLNLRIDNKMMKFSTLNVIKKHKIVGDIYNKIKCVIDNNSEKMYNITKSLRKLCFEVNHIGRLQYPMDEDFTPKIEQTKDITDHICYDNNTRIPKTIIDYGELWNAGLDNNQSVYCLLSLINDITKTNKKNMIQMRFMKYDEWLSKEIKQSTCDISDWFTFVINKILKDEDPQNFNDIQNVNYEPILAQICNRNTYSEQTWKCLLQNIDINIQYWIESCKSQINKKQSASLRGEHMIRLLKEIPDYIVDDETNFDAENLGSFFD